MGDILCSAMGFFDIVAGILVFIGFGSNIFGLIVGGVLIVKGVISFI